MREIKFRAWDKEQKVMLLPEHQQFILIPTMPSWGADKHFPLKEKIPDIDCFDWASANLLCGRYEVMQYIGLKDKNGKEIYEGDLIKTKYGVINQVMMIHGAWSFTGGGSVGAYVSFNMENVDKEKEVEIIGNIHENPELLKEK